MHTTLVERVGTRKRIRAWSLRAGHRWGWLAPLIAGPLLAIVIGQTPAAASSTAAPFILANDCVEHQAFLDGESAAVRAHLPGQYTALQDAQTGRPLLFARAEQCDVTVGGYTSRATLASFGVVIHSPDGMGCASGAPGSSQPRATRSHTATGIPCSGWPTTAG